MALMTTVYVMIRYGNVNRLTTLTNPSGRLFTDLYEAAEYAESIHFDKWLNVQYGNVAMSREGFQRRRLCKHFGRFVSDIIREAENRGMTCTEARDYLLTSLMGENTPAS